MSGPADSEYGSAGQIPLVSCDGPDGSRLPPQPIRRVIDRDGSAVIESRIRRPFLRRPRRESGIDLLFLLPTLAILAGFLFYPLVYGIVLSLHDTHGFDLTGFVGLDNYTHAIFGDAVFHQALLNTVVFTGAAVVLQTGLGLFLAVLVVNAKRGRTFFQFAFFVDSSA